MAQRIFVHRYRWSHDDRRKKMRRMKKDGLARVVWQNKDGWLYELLEKKT